MTGSLAERTRRAVRARPTLFAALRAGVLNYAAAARTLDVDGDAESVATALRRYAADLPPVEPTDRSVRLRMESGVGPAEDATDALLSVGGVALGADGTDTAIVATGEVDAGALATVLGRLAAEDVAVTAAGVAGDALVVVVDRRDGPDALRYVEDALGNVPG